MEIINQYDIIFVNLDPTIGSEIKKSRPCVVISPNEMNHNLNTITIAPITSTSKPYPSRIEINNYSTSGWIILDQIRTIDKLRVIRKFGKLDLIEIKKIKNLMYEIFVE
jgi:mRNA interferase MazF